MSTLQRLKNRLKTFRAGVAADEPSLAREISQLAYLNGLVDIAIQFAEHSCALSKTAENLINLGVIYRDFGRFEESGLLFSQLELQLRVGGKLWQTLEFEKANWFYKADQLDESLGTIKNLESYASRDIYKFFKSQVMLAKRNPEGLFYYFYRPDNPLHKLYRSSGWTRSQVKKYFERQRRKIFVKAEQGIGDFFYFYQFVHLLAQSAMFDSIIIEVDERIPISMIDIPDTVQILAWSPSAEHGVPSDSLVCGYGDLPLYTYLHGFGAGFFELPPYVPCGVLDQGSNPVVGISWATANPTAGFYRNVTPDRLIKNIHSVSGRENINISCLQYDTGRREDQLWSKSLFGVDAFALDETELWFRAIAKCDCVIANDSATAIIAGFFNIPTLMVTPLRSTWFVGTDPSHRHFRSISKFHAQSPYADRYVDSEFIAQCRAL